jgi:hypothetical protein
MDQAAVPFLLVLVLVGIFSGMAAVFDVHGEHEHLHLEELIVR